jgi:hypothetical protein
MSVSMCLEHVVVNNNMSGMDRAGVSVRSCNFLKNIIFEEKNYYF